jgi:hypothetical protein
VLNHKLLYSGTVVNLQHFEFNELLNQDLNKLKIIHKNKTNQDTVVDDQGKIIEDRSIELKQIKINDKPVKDTVLYNSPFYVDWPKNIQEDYVKQGQSIPEFIKNTLYFGFNGTYVYEFLNDSQREHFRQLWMDEIQSHQNQQIIEDNIDKFNRYGENVSTKQEFNLTIFDLKKMISQC